MAQFSLHAYDADVWIPEFRGLNQSDVGLNPDLRYAAEEQNMETPNGVLQPRAGIRRIEGRLDNPITMLTRFHRRYYTGSGTKDWFVCYSGSCFWYRQGEEDSEWTAIDLPTGITFSGSDWSVVSYEHTELDETVDVLLVSNSTDGMFMIVPPDRPSSWNDIKTHNWTWVKDYTWRQIKSPAWVMRLVNTRGKKFGVIERYADRIWGGDIADNPDMLMYSAVYLADEWRPYKPDADPGDPDRGIGEPEDGAGDVFQPSWDGDRFIALKQFGDQLLAIKEHHIWRIIGTNPGQFEFREQYGAGKVYKDTIVVYQERLFMATEDGLAVYDGMTVSPFKRKEMENAWRTRSQGGYAATVFNDKYILACAQRPDGVYNFAACEMFVVDFIENDVLYYKNAFANRFMQSDGMLYAVEPFIEDITPERFPGPPAPRPKEILGTGICEVCFDSWLTRTVFPEDNRWVSPWIDFGYKRIQKGGFDLYFIPEVKRKAVTLRFTIQTEKKSKSKEYTIQPLSGKQHRGKRLHFSGTGRRFRIIIETERPEEDAPWRLIGGIQLVVETDPD